MYADEFVSNLEHGLLCTFDISGDVKAGMRLYASIGYWPDIAEIDIPLFPDQTIFSFNVSHDVCFADRFEPNNSQATATDLGIAPGIHVDGTSISMDNDQDWYRFQVLRPSDSLDVKLDYAPSRGNLDMDVFDAGGHLVGRSNAVDTKDIVNLTDLAPGVYYVHVYAAPPSASGGPNSYKLYIDPSEKSVQRVLYVSPPDADPANSFYTLAPGNDANSGLSFLHPKATLASLIADQQIGPNDIVLFDTGTYSSGTAVLTAADAGAVFAGSPGGSILAYGGTRIEVNDSSGNLFSHLIFSGMGGTGIYIRGDGVNDAHDNLIQDDQFLGVATGVRIDSHASNTVNRNTFVGGSSSGVYVAAGAAATVQNNTISGSGSYGIYVGTGAAGTISKNDVAGRGTGIYTDSNLALVYDNDVHGNTFGIAGGGTIGPPSATVSTPANRVYANGTGIFISGANGAIVRFNEIYNNSTGIAAFGTNSQIFANNIYGNSTGLSGSDTLGPADWSLPNDIHDNNVGVATAAGGIARFNRIHDNTIGVSAGSNSTVVNNLIYRNIGTLVDDGGGGLAYSGRGVLLNGTQGATIRNNTIYTPGGDGIRLQGSASGNHLRDNIVWTENGHDLFVANDSQLAFDSDFNNLFTTGTGIAVWWQKDYADIYDWMIEAGYDQHSIGVTQLALTLDNPQFVNLATDDFHLTNQISTSIDAGEPALAFPLEPSSNGGRIDLGAYGNTSQAALSPASFIKLEFPKFYTDWEVARERPIVWSTFNLTGNVKIELFQEGVGKVADIGTAPALAGSFNWSPEASGITGDTFKRYRIHITSLSDQSITAQSREPFAVPIAGSDFYVDDQSNVGDEYTPTAIGDNLRDRQDNARSEVQSAFDL